MVINAQKATAQNQAHISPSIGNEAIEIVYHVLLLLDEIPVVYGEYQVRLSGVDFTRHVLVHQVDLVLLACGQTAGHVEYGGVARLLQLLGYVGQLVDLGGN